MRTAVLSSYRRLLRTIRTGFKNDEVMIRAAVQAVRSRYEAHRSQSDPEIIAEHLQEAQETAVFIRDYVVQSSRNEAGNFTLKLTPQQVAAMQGSSMEPINLETTGEPKPTLS